MKKVQKLMAFMILLFMMIGSLSTTINAFEIQGVGESLQETKLEFQTLPTLGNTIPKVATFGSNETPIHDEAMKNEQGENVPPVVKNSNGIEVREEKAFVKVLGKLSLTLNEKKLKQANRKIEFTRNEVQEVIKNYNQSVEWLKQQNLLSEAEMKQAKQNGFTWKEVVMALSTPQSTFRAYHSTEYQKLIANDLQREAYARIQKQDEAKNSLFQKVVVFFIGEKASADGISWTATYGYYLNEPISDLTINGEKVFCIEPYIPTTAGTEYNVYGVGEVDKIQLKPFQSNNLSLISYFGFTNSGGWESGSTAGVSRYVNTQKAIWNLVATSAGQAIFNKNFDTFRKNINVLNTNSINNSYFNKLKKDIDDYMDGSPAIATKTVKADGQKHEFGPYDRFKGQGGDVISDTPTGVDVSTDNQGYVHLKVSKSYKGEGFSVDIEEKGISYKNGFVGNPKTGFIAQKVGIFGDLPAPTTTLNITVEQPAEPVTTI